MLIFVKNQEFRVFCEMGSWNSLEHLKICEVKKKMNSPKALYRGRKEVGILLLKILRKMSAVGLVPHRYIRGT